MSVNSSGCHNLGCCWNPVSRGHRCCKSSAVHRVAFTTELSTQHVMLLRWRKPGLAQRQCYHSGRRILLNFAVFSVSTRMKTSWRQGLSLYYSVGSDKVLMNEWKGGKLGEDLTVIWLDWSGGGMISPWSIRCVCCYLKILTLFEHSKKLVQRDRLQWLENISLFIFVIFFNNRKEEANIHKKCQNIPLQTYTTFSLRKKV